MPLDALPAYRHVERESDCLVFSELVWEEKRRPSSRLLERFLTATSDVALLNFAKQFGPLIPDPLTTESLLHPTPVREPVDGIWRHLQWELSFLLELVSRLRENREFLTDPRDEFARRGITVARRYSLADVFGITKSKTRTAPQWHTWTRAERRAIAANVLDERVRYYVKSCGLRPALIAEPPYTHFEMVFQDNWIGERVSLLGALMVQFLATATGTGFATCSGCGRMFVPKRRQPAFGKRRYCPSCGRPAAVRAAKADWRARQRAARGERKR